MMKHKNPLLLLLLISLCLGLNAQTEFETEGQLIGIADDMDPDPKRHKIDYFLETKGKLKPVQLTQLPERHQFGKKVKFKGTQEGAVAKGAIQTTTELLPQLATLVDLRKMLVLLFKFQNSRRTYFTPERLEQELFNGAFQRFFSEHTGGVLEHTGKVFGWYSLPRNGEMGQGSMICEVTPDEVKQAMAFYKVNVHDYDTVVMVSNCTEYHTLGGRANLGAYDFLGVGKPLHFIKMAGKPETMAMPATDGYVPGWTGLIPLLVHERGHNLLYGHANGLDCGNSQVLHPCEHVEYGNKFDKMGGSDGAIAFNGDSQRKIGWKKETEFHHIKTPGFYTVDKVTSTKKNRKIGAYVYARHTNNKLFYLESRKPGGLDNKLSMYHFKDVTDGVLIYSNVGGSTATSSPMRTNEFRIIDPKPSELTWWADTGTESMSDEYQDPMTGVILRKVASTLDTITFSVEYNDELRRCDKSTPNQWASLPYVARFQNNNTGTSAGKSIIPTGEVIIRQSKVGLAPGDYFQLRVDTLQSEELMCPRKNFSIAFSNGTSLTDFFIPPTNTTGGSGGGGTTDPGNTGKSRPTTGGTSYGSGAFIRSASNITFTHKFPTFLVPASALNKDYKVTFRYEFAPNDIRIHEVMLYIRSDRRVPIGAATNNVKK